VPQKVHQYNASVVELCALPINATMTLEDSSVAVRLQIWLRLAPLCFPSTIPKDGCEYRINYNL
jgi:hypothetical protein